jgi:hypothetical protein
MNIISVISHLITEQAIQSSQPHKHWKIKKALQLQSFYQ